MVVNSVVWLKAGVSNMVAKFSEKLSVGHRLGNTSLRQIHEQKRKPLLYTVEEMQHPQGQAGAYLRGVD